MACRPLFSVIPGPRGPGGQPLPMHLWLGHSKNQGRSVPSPADMWVPTRQLVTSCTPEAHKWMGNYSVIWVKTTLPPDPSSLTRVAGSLLKAATSYTEVARPPLSPFLVPLEPSLASPLGCSEASVGEKSWESVSPEEMSGR